MYDAVVIGGGPAGLQAALTFARGQRPTLLIDGGVRRNLAARGLQNFVTRDGVPPAEFRALAHAELERYPTHAFRSGLVRRITGEIDGFDVTLDGAMVRARRIVLATGMIDVMLDVPGFSALWGRGIYQCPYCHGHEHRGERFAVWAPVPEMLELALLLRAWTPHVTAFTLGSYAITPEMRERLTGLTLDERAVAGLVGEDHLTGIALADGGIVPADVLFARPPQLQVPLVTSLGLALDAMGFVAVDGRGQTSRPGIYAAGDLTTPMQAAIAAASAGCIAAATACHSFLPHA